MSTKNTILGMNPVATQTRQAADIVAALLPPAKPGAPGANPPPAPKSSMKDMLLDFVPGLVGAVAGYKLFKKHPVLGALGGLAVGSSVMDAVKGGDDRLRAACRVGVAGAGIAGSLMWKKHPILGYAGGTALGVGAVLLTPQTKGLFGRK